MASEPPRRVLDPLTAPQHYMPPGARELRAQAVQRLQAGLFGIAAIVLIVGLASIINDRARQAGAATQSQASGRTIPAAQGDTDPLAEVGVVPSTAPDLVTAPQLAPSAPPARTAPAGPGN